jgi:hypothetical protein
MVRGMAHWLLGINDGYKPLKISIQGDFDSVTTNMQKVYKFRLPDVGRVFAGNFGNGDGTFFCKNGKDMAG